VRAGQNRKPNDADSGDFQKSQNKAQNINPRSRSDAGEVALQMDENKSAGADDTAARRS